MSPKPTRWMNDSHLAVDARALLRSAAPGPTPASLAAVWGRIEASTAGIPATTATPGGAWSLGKVMTLFAVGVLSTQLNAWSGQPHMPVAPVMPVAHPTERAARVTMPIPPPVQAPVAGPVEPTEVASLPSQAPHHAVARAGRVSARAAAASDPMTEEITLVAEGRRLLATDPSQALARANLHADRFPHGVLQHEREAVAIAALVRLRRLRDAQVRADRFLAAYPDSTSAPRIRALRDQALTGLPTP